MEQNIHIRVAHEQDIPQLRVFLQAIVKAERPMDKDLKPEFIEYYDPADFIHQNNAVAFVAEIDNELVGCGAAQIRPSKAYYKHDEHVHLAMMYVDDRFRGRGINPLIVEALKNWGVERGIRDFELTVYPSNASAIKAYEKAGFETALLEMRLHLD